MIAQIVTDKYVVGPWVAARINGQFMPESSSAIGLSRKHMIAGVIYENWNGASVVCHIAIEGPMTPAYLAAIFDYPFNRLGVQKIIVPVAESNLQSIDFVIKLGFNKEAQLLDAHPDGSLLLFTMNREQCKFIGERYGKKLIAATRA